MRTYREIVKNKYTSIFSLWFVLIQGCESHDARAPRLEIDPATLDPKNSSLEIDTSTVETSSKVREKNFNSDKSLTDISQGNTQWGGSQGSAQNPMQNTIETQWPCKFFKSEGTEFIPTNLDGRQLNVDLQLPVTRKEGTFSLGGTIYTFQHQQNYPLLYGGILPRGSFKVIFEIKILAVRSDSCSAEVKVLQKIY